MRFCTNCGKGNTDDAVFCIGCGTGMASGAPAAGQPENISPVIPGQANPDGAYYQTGTQGPASGAYYQPGAQGASTTYNQPGAPGTPGTYAAPGTQGAPGTPYSPPGAQGNAGAPYYQTGPQGTQGTPYYPNSAYNSGGPNYPGGGPAKNSKKTVIIVSVIIGVCLIAGGIFAYTKLSNKDNNNNNTSLSGNNTGNNADASIKPSNDVIEPSAAPSVSNVPEVTESAAPPSAQTLDMFDTVTQDNIIAACEEAGMDVTKITDVQSYGTWYEGEVYTFLYDDSVIDLLLYDDGTVFSVETGGVQVYLTGYESFFIDDYLGYTTHFDESYPDNGYAFYVNGNDVDSSVNMETSYDYDYVIELVDANDGSLALAFFMPAGETLLMGVPTGDYYIQYAAGPSWISVGDLFGPDTVFYKSDSIYSFYPENDSTITLDINGGSGIPSSEITINEF